MSQKKSLNVLGGELKVCCLSPMTGFYRDGSCHTESQDVGRHVICVQMTDSFLEFAREQGNDLITPRPEFDFPGLTAGDRWCVCALTWKQALEAGLAPPVVLEACHEAALSYVDLEDLQENAVMAAH